MTSDLRREASAYARDRLQGESLLREPPHPELSVIFVVPIYRESVRRVLDLLSSLANLKEMEHGSFEVLAVINNGKDDGTTKFHAARNANRLVMELPVWKNTSPILPGVIFPEPVLKQAKEIRSKITAYMIDKSSAGCELETGNAGAARDRGLAEAVARYLQLERNGLVIFLDADVVIEDREYLNKVLETFMREPGLSVVSGSIDYRFDPDVSQPAERKREIAQLERYLAMRTWELLQGYLASGTADLLPADACIGAHVLSRAFEAAAFGGWPHRATGEDTAFGKQSGSKKRPELRVNAALRYQHWMGREFDPSVDQAPLPFATEEMEELTRKISASVQGRALLERINDPAVLLYRSISVR